MTDTPLSVEMDVVAAAHVRKILFEHQVQYSYEFAPERINLIRDVIRQLDDSIEKSLKAE